jgi:hypothetical protein
MKISLGMAAVGLAAGGVLLAVGGKSEEPAKVEKPASKFTTPATDPGAEWEDKGRWAGCGYGHGRNGYLDGPRREAMFYARPSPSGLFQEDGYENVFRAYDPKTDRYMTVIGCGSEGTIDGPFSRVRLGGWGYSSTGGMASGNSSRYKYMSTREGNKDILRRLDFKKRVLERAATDVDVTGCQICGFEGGFFLLKGNNLRKVSDDGKLLAEYTLDKAPRESLGPYDQKNDRLYGSSREGRGGWVAWGWDLKAGGKFIGLLPAGRSPEDPPLRKQMATGPFKGSFFWCPGGLGFGPGGPDGRYLYMGGGDEANMYRLDLEKQEWIKLVPTADKKRWRFGEAPGAVHAWKSGGGIVWANDGTDNMYPGYRGWCSLYERVK